MRILLASIILFNALNAVDIHTDTRLISPTTHDIKVTFNLQPNEFLYSDFIDFSSNSSSLNLSVWHANQPPVKIFDPSFSRTMEGFKNKVTLELQAQTSSPIYQEAHVYLMYLVNSEKKLQQQPIALSFGSTSPATQTLETSAETLPVHTEKSSSTIRTVKAPKARYETWYSSLTTLKERLFDLIRKRDSWTVRLILIFLLGVLLSLTPCIYPMIPITAGVLQANAGNSVWYNFLLSLAYTTGIASTFATFGLIAAFTGQVFSQLLANPIVVILIALVLTYLALSLFDLYELKLPKFSAFQQPSSPQGSLLTTFLFGAASGTIASPCLSPGLALVLSIVAALGNKLLGFLILFIFGIGSSIPLLIVGTFSGSLKLLPTAGLWMVEVKKLFGLLLFGMVFYYLSNIIVWPIILMLIALGCFIAGVYYFYTIQSTDSRWLKRYKNSMGIAFIIASIFVGYTGIKTFYAPEVTDTLFSTDYHTALTRAQAENKKLFLDFGASYCTVCKLLDATLLQDPQVRTILQEQFIPVKVDGSDASKEPYRSLQKQYAILGLPTFLVIDNTGQLIKKWQPEPNKPTAEEFVKQLQELAHT